MTFSTGDQVVIEAEDRVVPGEIILASDSGISLMLSFEAILFGYAGVMPVLLCDDGVYRTLFGKPVTIRRKQ